LRGLGTSTALSGTKFFAITLPFPVPLSFSFLDFFELPHAGSFKFFAILSKFLPVSFKPVSFGF
jgi:hypothetical protein